MAPLQGRARAGPARAALSIRPTFYLPHLQPFDSSFFSPAFNSCSVCTSNLDERPEPPPQNPGAWMGAGSLSVEGDGNLFHLTPEKKKGETEISLAETRKRVHAQEVRHDASPSPDITLSPWQRLKLTLPNL